MFWNRLTNITFTTSTIVALVSFCIARFELVPITGITALFLDVMLSVDNGEIIVVKRNLNNITN